MKSILILFTLALNLNSGTCSQNNDPDIQEHFNTLRNSDAPFERHQNAIVALEQAGVELLDMLAFYRQELDYYEGLGQTGYEQRPMVFEEAIGYLRTRLEPPSDTLIPETQE